MVRNSARAKKLKSFLADGFNDYIGARVLFLEQLPKQGAILSSTAIEKCFKAFLAFGGNESHGHLKTAHWKAMQNFDRALFSKLDLSFIKLNQRAYKLRYTDGLPLDFNLIISSREFLAELDHTVSSMFERLTIEENGKAQQTPYEVALSTPDERLIKENHVIAREEKQAFILRRPQLVYEVRNDPVLGLIEVTYVTTNRSEFKGAGFLRPGLVPRLS